MEKNVIRERLVEAAVLAIVPRPSERPGVFTIGIEVSGVKITYTYETGLGHHAIDHITTWDMLEQGVKNPLVFAMISLIASAKDYSP